MAKIHAHQTRIWLDEHKLSQSLTSWEQALSQEQPVVTALEDEGPRHRTGNYDAQLSYAGLFDPADLNPRVHALLSDGEDHYAGHLIGAADGSVAYDIPGRLVGEPISGAAGGPVLLTWTASGSGGVSRGLVMGSGLHAAANNRPGIDIGAKVAGPIYRVVFRLAAKTSGNIILRIGEADAEIGPYTVVTALTSGSLAASGIVVAETSGVLKRWLRVQISGGFTDAEILVTAGIVIGD